jgi:biopolymer transport protein ExbB
MTADAIARVFEDGGWVTYALAAVSFLLWSAVWLRMAALRRGFSGSLEDYAASRLDTGGPPPAGVIPRFLHAGVNLQRRGELERVNHLAQRATADLAFLQGVVRTLVAIAPLLGLLGTVAGMVQMFGSLHGGAAGSTREATVAGGISTALITTQLGLVIGAPGLVAARLLSRRELRLTREIQQTRSLLVRLGESE